MNPKTLLGEMVGDPGIEPGVGLPGGVTVRCRTLQHVALTLSGGIPKGAGGVKRILGNILTAFARALPRR